MTVAKTATKHARDMACGADGIGELPENKNKNIVIIITVICQPSIIINYYINYYTIIIIIINII